MAWILTSFKANRNLGSSGLRSMKGTWGPVYPETTGYLVPTLLDYAAYFDDRKVKKVALKQLSYFKSIQNEDGSFRQSAEKAEPIIFDTAQILFGLLRIASEVEAPNEVLHMIIEAVDWLGVQLDDQGLFTDYNYVDDFNPAYYTRVAWAMASSELIKYSKPRTKTKKLIWRLASLELENHFFRDAGFHSEEPALTHTLAYTLRGLWECGELLNDRKLKKKVRQSMNALNERIQEKGKVAGSYNENWTGDYSFLCSTGNAQLALLSLLMYERSGFKKNLANVELLLQPLLKAQRGLSLNSGAIPSSIPMRGKYQRMKYTNWTQKFFCDAVLTLLKMQG